MHQWYRSLDFLITHKDELESDLFEQDKDLFNQEIDIVLMDTTSVVYWGDEEKVKAVQVTLSGKSIILRTELERDAHLAFKAAALKIPPRLLSEPPDIRETVVLRS